MNARNAVPAWSMCLLLLAARVGLAADAAAPGGSGYQAPRILQRATITWPGEPDREAMVYLTMTVTTEGLAADVELAEGGFHEPRFVEAAKHGAATLRLQPALLNGVPVVRRVLWPVSFSLSDDNKGITPDFQRELRKVDGLIRAGDYAGGHFHAQWMLAEKVRLKYEYAVLQAELAQTHAAVGNSHRALEAARTVTTRTEMDAEPFVLHQPVRPNPATAYLLPKEVIASVMQLRIRLALANGMLLEALQAYYDLAGMVALKPDDPLVAMAAKITQALEGDTPLVARVQLTEKESWRHGLFRRRFTVQNVKGAIDGLLLECTGKRQKLEYEPGSEWKVPTSWGECELVVDGDTGTTFEIVELAGVDAPRTAG